MLSQHLLFSLHGYIAKMDLYNNSSQLYTINCGADIQQDHI